MTKAQRSQRKWWTNKAATLLHDWQGPFKSLDEALDPSRERWGPVFVACRGTTFKKMDRGNAVTIDLTDTRSATLSTLYAI